MKTILPKMCFGIVLLVFNATIQASDNKMDHSKHDSMQKEKMQNGKMQNGKMQHDKMQKGKSHDGNNMQHDAMKHEDMHDETLKGDGDAMHHKMMMQSKNEHHKKMERGDHKMEHDSSKMSHHKAKKVTSTDGKMTVLDAIPASGKVREAGYDGKYVMEATSAYDPVKEQCAKASRGLVILDNKSWKKCGVKTKGIAN